MCEDMELLSLNLRGTIFVTKSSTLEKAPEKSPLADCLTKNSDFYKNDRNEYFFDRNPAVFHHILDYLISGKLHVPHNVCPESAREEFKFWGIPQSQIEKCCWKPFYQMDEDMDTLKNLLQSVTMDGNCTTNYSSKICPEENPYKFPDNTRMHVWNFLHDFSRSSFTMMWYIFICITIIVSTTMFLLSSVPSCRVARDVVLPYPHSDDDPPSNKSLLYWNTTMHPTIFWVDVVCNAVLTIEWSVRFITCPDRKKFILTFINLSDIIACISIWAACIMEGYREIFSFIGSHNIILLLGLIYCSRIMRVFRLAHNFCGMRILILTIKSSWKELVILVVSFTCFSMMFATLIYMAELSTSSFGDIFESIWWSIITMTTVGYGDFVPITGQGFVVGSLCSVAGILLIALPVAIISSNFHSFFSYNQYRRRHWLDKCKDKEN